MILEISLQAVFLLLTFPLFSFNMLVFCFILLSFFKKNIFLFSLRSLFLMRDKKGVDLGGRKGDEELDGGEGSDSKMWIY